MWFLTGSPSKQPAASRGRTSANSPQHERSWRRERTWLDWYVHLTLDKTWYQHHHQQQQQTCLVSYPVSSWSFLSMRHPDLPCYRGGSRCSSELYPRLKVRFDFFLYSHSVLWINTVPCSQWGCKLLQVHRAAVFSRMLDIRTSDGKHREWESRAYRVQQVQNGL